jgi:hypothetical protein
MATFTISFSVADEHMDRIRVALRKHFGPVHVVETDPVTGEERLNIRELTGAELLDKVREMSINNVKSIVMAVESEEAMTTARQSVSSVEVT